jgi:hypothetical protein
MTRSEEVTPDLLLKSGGWLSAALRCWFQRQQGFPEVEIHRVSAKISHFNRHSTRVCEALFKDCR